MVDANKPLFFLHIPKCAGVSFRAALAARFPASMVLHVEHPERVPASELKERPFALAHGHVGWSYLRTMAPDAKVVSVVREPTARILSLYHFWRTFPEDKIRDAAEVVRVRAARDQSFEEFLADSRFEVRDVLDNHQVRMVGEGADARENCLELALGRLENEVEVMGLAERLGDSLWLAQRRLGWWSSECDPPRLNVGTRRGVYDELSAVAKGRLAPLIEHDQAFYAAAASAFERALSEAECKVFPAHPPPTEPGVAWAATRYGAVLDMGMPICGSGWDEREGLETGMPWRFMSRNRATLWGNLGCGKTAFLLVWIPFAEPGFVFAGVTLFIDDVTIQGEAFTRREGWLIVSRPFVAPNSTWCLTIQADGAADSGRCLGIRSVRIVESSDDIDSARQLVHELSTEHVAEVQAERTDRDELETYAMSLQTETAAHKERADHAQAHARALLLEVEAQQQRAEHAETYARSLRAALDRARE